MELVSLLVILIYLTLGKTTARSPRTAATTHRHCTQKLPLRYVVHKGLEGFGDRLEQLLYVVHYATVTERAVVFDWEDSMFGAGKLTFEDFFRMYDIPWFTSSDFNQLYKHGVVGSGGVHPAPWAKVMARRAGRDMYTENTGLRLSTYHNEQPVLLEIIQGQRQDFCDEIVVYTGAGEFRTGQHHIFDKHIEFTNRIVNLFQRQFVRYFGYGFRYSAVHLRGADKPWRCEKASDWLDNVSLAYYNGTMDSGASAKPEYWKMQMDEYLSVMMGKLRKSQAEQHVILISDSVCLTARWLDLGFPGITAPLESFAAGSLHELNVLRLLWDFSLLVRSDNLVIDNSSMFGTLAHYLRQDGNPQLRTWMWYMFEDFNLQAIAKEWEQVRGWPLDGQAKLAASSKTKSKMPGAHEL